MSYKISKNGPIPPTLYCEYLLDLQIDLEGKIHWKQILRTPSMEK